MVEADTYTPLFYKGRAEPTGGSPVRLIAILRDPPAGDVVYNWRVDGRVIADRGQAITIIAPDQGSFTVQLSVLMEGQLVAERNDTIYVSNPQVLLYEVNPLRGQSATAIGSEYALIGAEAELAAVPYFTASGASLRGIWRVDGQPIPLSDSWRQLILKRPEESKEHYHIGLEVTADRGMTARMTRGFMLNLGI